MASPIEILNHRLTLAIGVITLIGFGLAFMDSRHASASDILEVREEIYDVGKSIQSIANSISDAQIDELEFELTDLDRRAARINRIPEAERTEWNRLDLEDLDMLKERYLRKLKRLEKSEP